MALNRGLFTTIATKLSTEIEVPLSRLLPRRPIKEIAFLIGCGRSGTTIFGECLARHSAVTYVHEPREFWASAFPETDIWTSRASRRNGRLLLDADDATPEGIEQIRRLLEFQVWKSGRSTLVEKLPINNFRLGLLSAVAPDGRFIHLLRDAREVARSIQKRADNSRNHWWGRDNYKWRQLAALAEARGICDSADSLCQDNYERGLLEWRLSMEVFQETRHHAQHVLEVSYNNLVERPAETLDVVLDYLHLDSCAIMLRFVHEHMQRRTPKINTADATPKELEICGDHLLRVRDRLAELQNSQDQDREQLEGIAGAMGSVSTANDESLALHSLQAPARVTMSGQVAETKFPSLPETEQTLAEERANNHQQQEEVASYDRRPPANPKKRKKRNWLIRTLMAIGVLYAFGPHLWLIKLLGPRWGIRWARLTAHLHWLLTWLGIHSQTRRALERLQPHFRSTASVSKMLHEHLLLKHQSFAEWRLAATPAGRRYMNEVYDLPHDLEPTVRGFQDAGTGVLVIVYHFGMYKVLASAMAEKYERDIYKANYLSAHYRTSTLGPIAQWAFRNAVRTNQASSTKEIYLRPDAPPIALVKRLKRGQVVGIAADGMISDSFESVEFLGGVMRLPSGWAKLAAATQSAVIVMFASLESAHQRKVTATPPFFVENDHESIVGAVQRAARELEAHVSETPWQWHIWHRVEFAEDESGVCQMSSHPMVLDPDAYHYEKTPR